MAKRNGGGYEAAGRGERFGKDARLGIQPLSAIGSRSCRLVAARPAVPPHQCGEEMDDANADLIRLHDAGDTPVSRAT